jgi:hypothetical protein
MVLSLYNQYMDNQQRRIFELLEKYEQDLTTNEEVNELQAWYQTFDDGPDIMAGLSGEEKIQLRENMLNRILDMISDQLGNKISKTKNLH